jgi:phosphopantetheine--protein transferase-like protein
MKPLSIGNDIVDFSALKDKHLDGRFRKRVFTQGENNQIDSALNKARTLWSIWAAKEAAFKAYQGRHLSCVFSPILFEVDLVKSIVCYQHQRIMIKVKTIDEATCHCVALYGGKREDINRIKISFKKHLDSNQSEAVRALAYDALDYGQNISIKRPPFVMPDGRIKKSPPRFYAKETPLAIGLSLSHDGAYISSAILPLNSR